MDYTPRNFDAECCNILCNFAEIVVRDSERYALEVRAAACIFLSSFYRGVCCRDQLTALDARLLETCAHRLHPYEKEYGLGAVPCVQLVSAGDSTNVQDCVAAAELGSVPHLSECRCKSCSVMAERMENAVSRPFGGQTDSHSSSNAQDVVAAAQLGSVPSSAGPAPVRKPPHGR